MDAKELFTWAWLDTFICLSCSGYKLETCFLWKNLFCSCCCWEVTAGTPWLFQPVLLRQWSAWCWFWFLPVCAGGAHSIQCMVSVGRGHSLFYYLLHVPVACQRARPRSPPPLWLSLWFPSREFMARHPAAVVCEEGVIWGRGWIFTVMEGGVFANNP